MKKRIDIAHIPKKNIFTVPVGYFDELPLAIRQKIAAQKQVRLEDISKESVFELPLEYFEDLPLDIQKRILELQKEIQTLPKAQNIFEVPQFFFEELEEKIAQKTILAEPIKVENISKETIFDVPKSYFEGLPLQIQQKIQARPVILDWKNWRVPAYTMAIASVILLGVVSYTGWGNLWSKKSSVAEIKKSNDEKISQKEKIEKPTENTEVKIPHIELAQEQVKENQYAVKITKKSDFQPIKKVLKNVSKQDILAYLEEDLAHDDWLDLVSEQAAEGRLLLDLEEDLVQDSIHDITDEELQELDLILTPKKQENTPQKDKEKEIKPKKDTN